MTYEEAIKNINALNAVCDKKDFYDAEFESMYNPYPVQMSRSEAFGKARNDGLITDEEYSEAREFYGNLWRYTGD